MDSDSDSDSGQMDSDSHLMDSDSGLMDSDSDSDSGLVDSDSLPDSLQHWTAIMHISVLFYLFWSHFTTFPSIVTS